MEPPVDTICAALAELDTVRAPAFERTFEYVDDAGKVIGVNGVSARPSLEVFERLAQVVEDLRVDELDRSVRCQNRNESGNPVDDIVESELALHSALVTASFLTPKLASVRPDVRSRETFKRVFGVWSETIRNADARHLSQILDLLAEDNRLNALLRRVEIATYHPHLGLLRPERCEGGHHTVYAGRREADVVMTSMFMGVNSKCAHQVRPPRTR